MIFDFRAVNTIPHNALWGKELFYKTLKFLCILLIPLIPVNVHALGFGKIKTNSALNEIMDAEIPLLSATKSDIGSLEIKLASPEVFQRFGTDRPNLLNLLKFEVKQKSGLSYIKISSKRVIREPFLDFWLEMNSKNERIIKNFVVLLDPPHLKQADPVSVLDAPAAEEIEPEPIIEESVSEPQESPFTEPEPSILDEEVAVTSAGAAALFPDTQIEEEPVSEAESGQLIEPEADPEPVELIEEPQEIETTVADAFSEPGAEDSQAVKQDNLDREEPLEPVTEAEPEALEPVAEAEPEQLITDEPDLAFDDSQTESFAEDDGLFPRIPLSDYSEPTEDQFDAEPAFAAQPIEPDDTNLEAGLADPDSMQADNESQEMEQQQASAPVGDLDYGITKKNDNLWQIAEKLRAGSSDATVYQIMMALLQSNPDAFIDNNVHRLKVGHVLRVEDKGLLQQISQSQAIDMYQDQTEQWQNFRQNVAENVETQAVDTSDVSFTESAPDEDQFSSELTLATPDSQDAEISTGVDEAADAQQLSDLAILRDDLKRAISEASSSGSQNPELSKKLLDLEDEINSMQRMLTVEDDELASLQQQLHEINERNATAAEQAQAEEEQLAQSNPEAVGEPEEVIPEQTMDGVGDVEEIDTTLIDEEVPQDAAVNDEDLPPLDETEEGAGIVGTIMGMVSGVVAALISNIIYIGGAIAALVLLILTIVILKRRNANNDGSNESILLGSEENDISSLTKDSEIPSGPVSAGVDSTSSEESSFLSDFAISGMNAIEEDNEVDPLTEADVFMAYGRYEAAEERLQDAIKSDPNRSELKLKLIELYYTTKNKESFESTAEEFYASLGGNAGADPMWEKVLSMGAEIAPDNPIFSGGSPPEDGMNISSASMSKSDVMDIGLDTGVFDSPDLSSTATDDAQLGGIDTGIDAGGDYNFDLGIDTTGDLGGDIAKEQSSGLEFDLNLDTKDDIGSGDDSTSLDFNLDSVEPTEEMNPAGAGSMEFELGSTSDLEPESELMDLGLDESSDTADSTAEIDASGLDFDLPADNDLGLDDDLEITPGMDEVGTKLDLAKAYIDMGDSNGARSILDEVIDEGNDSQKQEAQELIHQIV
ncbi:MAG: FimV/HubP family polar landmark protein [Gammaproteobacteria bacterium]